MERGRVTKSFRGRTPWARLADRMRARREAESLELLAAAGVPVPRLLGLEHLPDGTSCVHIEAIPDARTAEEALGPEPGREALIGRLARLLGGLQAAGIDHDDLHAKNALVDTTGNVFAIDFHAARAVGPSGLGPRLLERDLVALAASHRELLGLFTRQRFFVAWLRGLPPAMRESLGPRGVLAARIENLGRARRLAVARAYAHPTSRFFRESGSCRELEAGRLARREAPGGHLDAALADESHPALLKVEGTLSQVEKAWGTAARLFAHGLAGPSPLLLDRRDPKRARAWFDFRSAAGPLPLDTPLEEPALPPSPTERATLDHALAFRGLDLEVDVPATFRRAGGQLVLAHTARLTESEILVRSARNKQKARRRARRERAASLWPRLCAPPFTPFTRLALAVAARAARFGPLERRLRRNLAIGLPERDAASLTPLVRRHMARLACEWGQLGADPAMLADQVSFDSSVSHLDTALAAGHGVIVITPHLGNWELLAAAVVARGARGAVVGRRRLRDPSAHILEELRARAGVETLPQDSSPRELLRRLARGEVIGLLPDVEVQRLAGLRLPFLGHDALVMSAPAALARAARLPLLPARCVLDESSGKPRGAYRIEFAEPIPPPATREATRGVTEQWVALFEAWIRETPSQWLWIHDRWRTSPSAADKVPLGALRQVQRDTHGTPT
jgi:KDO2-lipid IV(A) lauroyltransferase